MKTNKSGNLRGMCSNHKPKKKPITTAEREMMITIGAEMRRNRLLQNKSAAVIGSYLNLSKNTIIAYETGRLRMTLFTAIHIADKLNMSLDQFFISKQKHDPLGDSLNIDILPKGQNDVQHKN